MSENISLYYLAVSVAQEPQKPEPKKPAEHHQKAETNKPTSEEESSSKIQPKKDSKKKGKEETPKFTLKTPKGTKDYDPKQMTIREACTSIIKEAFKRHGAVTIDTPVFELRETLMGKYGEDSKLIYDLQDQGGELCSLRYDLTVPFARYVAMNNIQQMRRYQIGKVYRRDNPATTRGRFREFCQCDFDICGSFDVMIADSECLSILCDILTEVNIGDFRIKLNHRKLLDGIFAICGVPAEKFCPICSAVDKLDKISWEEVREEMTKTKGLDAEVADKIKEFVLLKGPAKQMLKQIQDSGKCKGNQTAIQALEELELLFSYTDSFGITDKIIFDLSLVRGLDYYTGVVFEAILVGGSEVGSISGGGRYDNLVGMFGNTKIPAVGFSIGLERLFTIAEGIASKIGQARDSETEVFILSAVKNSIQERMKLASELWSAGFKAEFLPKVQAKLAPQLSAAEKAGVPFAVIFGEDELAAGTISIKDMKKREQITVKRSELCSTLRKLLSEPRCIPLNEKETQMKCGEHSLSNVAFTRSPLCGWCARSITGVVAQGYYCGKCKQTFHTNCISHVSELPCSYCSSQAPSTSTK